MMSTNSGYQRFYSKLYVVDIQACMQTPYLVQIAKKGKEESMNLICIGATATLPQATIQLQIIMPQNFENGYLDMHAYTCEQILGGVGHGFKSVAYRTAWRRNQGRNAYLGKGSTLAYLELRHDALSPW